MNFDPALIAAVLVCLVLLAWALLERRRAAAAEARAWELREAMSETEVRARVLEDQARTSSEVLRAQAAEQANQVAAALLERTNETFRQREELAEQRLHAQLKPVAESLAKFQEQVTAV
jgi:DNA recombination protein RmuC